MSGVVVRLWRLLRRSRREVDETVRVAEVNAFRTSMVRFERGRAAEEDGLGR